jgi:hypothetical protein
MTRLNRSAKHDRTNGRRPKAMTESAGQRSAANLTGSVPDFVFLPNAHDQFAVIKLRSTPIGELAVDLLVRNDPQLAPQLRNALVSMYFRASQARELRKATKHQISSAQSALNCLIEATELLEKVTADGRSGLHKLLEGPRLDDEKGEKEANQFSSVCGSIRFDVTRSMVALE